MANNVFDTAQVLIGRNNELSKLEAFLSENVAGKYPGSLYISGPPGTGKTACTRKALEKLSTDGVANAHLEVYVNCMQMKTPGKIYRYVFDRLNERDSRKGGKRKALVPLKHLPEELERELTKPKGKMIVLVMDEIDQLETKNREILYSAFRWPSLPLSRVILVGIANSLDLTKRLLPKLNLNEGKIPHQLQFRAYNAKQVVDILQNKLSQEEFDSSAVELCARKVSAITGDIRKALDICRMSLDRTPSKNIRNQTQRKRELAVLEIQCSESSSPKVSCREVLDTVRDVYGSKIDRLSLSLPLQQKLLLASALALSSSGKKLLPQSLVISAYKKACVAARVAPLDSSECSNLCELLEAQGLLSVVTAKASHIAQVRLLVDDASAKKALNDETLVAAVMKAVL